MMMVDRPKILGTLQMKVLFKRRDGNLYCIGTIESDHYISVPEYNAPIIFHALSLMDGYRSIAELQACMDRDFEKHVDVATLVDICCREGLLTGCMSINESMGEFHTMLTELASFSLTGTQQVFEVVSNVLPFLVLGMLCIDATAVYFVSTGHIEIPWSEYMANPLIFPVIWVIQILSILFHEFSHAVVAKRYGLRPKVVTLCVFYYFGLAMYVSIPGIYFKAPRARLAIWCAGIFSNAFLSAVFVFIQYTCGGIWYLISTIGIIINLGIIISNILPILYSDGYYVLSTLLKVPNLRKYSIWSLKSISRRSCSRMWAVRLIYGFVVVCVLGAFILTQITAICTSVMQAVSSGSSLAELICGHINLLLAPILGIGIRTVTWYGRYRHKI